MDAETFLRINSALSATTPWELRFVTDVLARVPKLDFQFVAPQRPFRDAAGRRRYIDFAIVEGERVRIAIEVDGYDKAGAGAMTPAQFADWSRRETALVAQGWAVLRFANVRIRDEPDRCALEVAAVLRAQRLAARPPRGESPQHQPPRPVRDSSAVDRPHPPSTAAPDIERPSPRRWRRLPAVAAVVLAGMCARAEARRSDARRHGSDCGDPLPLDLVEHREGERVAVTGAVTDVEYRRERKGTPTYIRIGDTGHTDPRVEVLIWAETRRDFEPGTLDSSLAGTRVCAVGVVHRFGGRWQVVIRSAGDLRVFGEGFE